MSEHTELEITLPSADVRGSLEFYTRILGFRKVWNFDEFCTVAVGRCCISFYACDGKIPAGLLREDRALLRLSVCDIHGLFETVRRANAGCLISELELKQPGVWDFSIKDNNGYHLAFTEARSA